MVRQNHVVAWRAGFQHAVGLLSSAHETLALTLCSLLTFYPFCAFFTLYYNIMSSTDPIEYEEDICNLEKVVSIMTRLASIRLDFVPIADALNNLNDVSRALHSKPESIRGLAMPGPPSLPRSLPEMRFSSFQEGQPLGSYIPQRSEGGPSSPTPQQFTPFDSLQNLSSILPPQPGDDLSGTFGVPFQLQNQIAFGSESLGTDPEPTRPETARTVSQPLDFVRAIENELIWRDWHESWWNSENGATDLVAAGCG